MFVKRLAGHWLVVTALFGLLGFISLSHGSKEPLFAAIPPEVVAAAAKADTMTSYEICLVGDDLEAIDWEERATFTSVGLC